MVLKITKTARDNTFKDCEINGNVEIAGKGTKMVRTKIRELKKEHPLVWWITFLSACIGLPSGIVGLIIFFR
jgi:hypothetical protein